MLWAVIQLVGGFLLLTLAADRLIAGASALALRLGISVSVVALTVVAYGTSFPEMTVSAVSALTGKPEIALGNVIGSNIANVGMIIGVAALLRPMTVLGTFMKRDYPVLLGVLVLMILFLMDGIVSRPEGAVLFALGIGYTAFLVYSARRERVTREESDVPKDGSRMRQILYIVLGFAGLVAGGRVGVQGAVEIARNLGMSERVIGLTIVALGTSLPELAASLVALRRKEADLAIGNIVGSCIFNVIFVLGLSATIHAIVVPRSQQLMIDLSVMSGMALLFGVFMFTARRLTRMEGFVLLGGFVGYNAYLIL